MATPLLKTSYGDRVSQTGYQSISRDNVTTKNGVVNATLILLTICVISGIGVVWTGMNISPSIASTLGMVGAVGVLVSTLVLLFSPSLRQNSKAVGIIMAILQGMMLGGFTFFAGTFQYRGADGWNLVGQALMGTTALFLIALLLYRTGAVRVSSTFTKVVVFGAAGFGALYAINLGITLVTGSNPLMSQGPISIIVGVVAILLGTMSLIQDFDTIDKMVEAGTEKSYTWMLATALLSSLVWLYMEILRVRHLLSQ